MTAPRWQDVNTQLLRVLGITQKNTTGVDITVRPSEFPRVTIDCLIDARTMLHEVSHFDLVLREEATPAPRPAFDLDALCAQARTRLTADVQHSASMAQAAHHKESAAIRARMDKALSAHRAATAKALLRIDISPMVAQLGRSLFGNGLGGFFGAGCSTGVFGGLK